jgi:protein associated with RNAse G/E
MVIEIMPHSQLTNYHAAYYKLASYFLRMAELALVDYFVMGEAIGIVATFAMAFYYSRKQMQKLSTDIETKVLSDMDEKIHDLTKIAIEKPQLIYATDIYSIYYYRNLFMLT